MNKTLVTAAGLGLAAILSVSVYAQEVPPNGPFGGVQRGGPNERQQAMRERMGDRVGFFRGGAGTGNEMLFRMIQDPQIAREIGLSDEKAKTLRDAFVSIQEKQIDLQAELSKLNLQQAGQVAGLLADRGKNPDEALKLIEEIGKINTEMSKLAVERILAIRENLTHDQIAKARETATKRMEQMRTGMMNRGGDAGEGRRVREGGEDRVREGREGGGDRVREGREGGEARVRREGDGGQRRERPARAD